MQVLGVGVATLDIIDTVASYPTEDSKQRAASRRLSRGGNAANTLVVLSQLGHQCNWAGVLADDASARQIVGDFEHHHIDIRWAKTLREGVTPTSYILLSREHASRTIIHYRDLPEFDIEAFSSIDLGNFDWLHFEGRNVSDCQHMLTLSRRRAGHARISLEVEQPRDGIEQLFPLADVLLFSRTYAEAMGWHDPLELFTAVRRDNPAALLFAAWGDVGGWCFSGEGGAQYVPAYHPDAVRDTLGAGDVFNAGVIHGLLSGKSPHRALHQAIELAGKKCGQIGFDGLGGDYA
ncbi:MAG: ketohexokinase [Candidatus Thiodiazotropha sp. (ex Semelilucina semeliformis)]|nr:ketohexokinase [Candidatus Thiodiazotropha sp. (ex Semelilucina semeliformis)]